MAILKVIEVLANSNKSWEDATAKAVAQASKSVKNIRSVYCNCLLYTSPSPRDLSTSRMPSSA